jgi:hypothetical protein
MAENFAGGPMGLNPMAGMLDSMEMVKRAWSSFNLPASLAPTLDPEELARRIKDLKTVEQWLTVNLGILQSSIQALEAQRSAIVAMHAFGDAMKPGASTPSPRPAPEAARAAGPEPAGASATDAAANPAVWWDVLRSQFEQVANSALGMSAAMTGGQSAAPKNSEGAPRGKRTSRPASTRSRKTSGG